MSSLNKEKKKECEKVLVEIAKRIRGNNPVDKNDIFKEVEKNNIILTATQEKELLKMVLVLHKKVKNKDIPSSEAINEVLYPEETARAKEILGENKVITTTVTDGKIKKALEEFRTRATTSNAHIVLKQVIENFEIPPSEQIKLRAEAKKINLSESRIIDKKGDINVAFKEVKAIFHNNPYDVDDGVIGAVAEKNNVCKDYLKLLFKKKTKELMEERRKNEVI